jgi:HPt (histidine-containing phosphotransfer) domain-containing protein
MERETRSVIDWPQLLMLRELQPPDEPDVIADLIATFKKDSSARLERLRAAAASGNLTDVGHEAHALKGSAATLGAELMRGEAEHIEAAVRANDLAPLPPLVTRLAEALREAQAELAKGPPSAA